MCMSLGPEAVRRLASPESSWFCNDLAGSNPAQGPQTTNYSKAACVSLTAQYAAGVPQMVVEVASVPK
jgi:hypothetical protein